MRHSVPRRLRDCRPTPKMHEEISARLIDVLHCNVGGISEPVAQ